MEATPAENNEPKRFDLIVHHRDPKTGLVVKSDPYILRVVGETGSSEKSQYWERPAGSGNLFDKENNPIGRWVYEEVTIKGKKVRKGKFEAGVEHIAFERPMTADQKLAQAVIESTRENDALKAELAALKAESEKKSGGPTPKKPEHGA
jgi:hypothetical protein